MSTEVEIPTHELDDPDPEDELSLLEELLEDVVAKINKVSTNLGTDFDRSLRLLGYRAALQRSRDQIVDALRLVTELGVALFQRGSFGPDVTVTLSIRGTTVDVAGGSHGYNSAPRWIDATSAAMTLRHQASIDGLCRFDPASFEGSYDAYEDLYARALMSFHQGGPGTRELLQAARREAAAATVFPELGQRFGLPLVGVAQAVLAEDASAFEARLADGLRWYRTLYQRPGRNHEANAVVPLPYLGLCALAHDRGLACRVRSDYIPSWLVDGSFREA